MFRRGKVVELHHMPFRHDHAVPEAQRFTVENDEDIVVFEQPVRR